LLCAQWKTADDGQRNCPKHVEFYSKNKFEKLVHVGGFIIRIYHDARSPERTHTHVCVRACVRNLYTIMEGNVIWKFQKSFWMIIEFAVPNLIEIGPWERGRNTDLLSHGMIVWNSREFNGNRSRCTWVIMLRQSVPFVLTLQSESTIYSVKTRQVTH